MLRITPLHRSDASITVRCHLSTLMGRDKLRIADVSRLSGVNRSTVSALYRESAVRVDLIVVGRLCQLFKCSVGDLFELVNPDDERLER